MHSNSTLRSDNADKIFTDLMNRIKIIFVKSHQPTYCSYSIQDRSPEMHPIASLDTRFMRIQMRMRYNEASQVLGIL